MWIFLLETLLFLLSVILCFYLPGKLFLHRLKLNLVGISGMFLATTAGLTSFTFLIYLLSWIHAPWISMPIVFVVAFYVIKNRLWVQKVPKQELYPILFIII